jgi:hypothetical protein
MKEIILPADAEIGHIITEKLSVGVPVIIVPTPSMCITLSDDPMMPKDLLRENDLVFALVEKDEWYLSGTLFCEIINGEHEIWLEQMGLDLKITKKRRDGNR